MPKDRGDLCSTCLYAPSCVNLSRPAGRVFECEEFYVPGSSRPPGGWGESTPGGPSVPGEAVKRRGAKSEGLCFDCGNRPHCTMRAVEGGVWHCEEYC